VRLAEMLPQPDETRTVWVPEYEVPTDDTLHLLWCPPYSEQNGWDEQPSEIALSQIVTGRVRRTHPSSRRSAADSPARPLGTNEVQCEIAVHGRVPLLQCMRDAAHVPPSLASPRPTRDACVIWQNVRSCGTAAVGEFTYVSALSGEAHVELILRRHGESIIVHYEQYWVDGWSDCAIGFWQIEGSVQQALAGHLSGAQVVHDRSLVTFCG
jgi:hypothetical protein